jgi:hypothetical protein
MMRRNVRDTILNVASRISVLTFEMRGRRNPKLRGIFRKGKGRRGER